MNNISAAKETIKITEKGSYTIAGKEVKLTGAPFDKVEVCTPEKGGELIKRPVPDGDMCRIIVTNEDSFSAASRYERPYVMNFANAHKAGGGFMLGANTQEESLCRCSTLYASIHSDKAAEMYRYNNTHLSTVESDYMLYSPEVCVFRSKDLELLEEPFQASVITTSAPNRYGAAFIASKQTVEETFLRRIRIVLRIAEEHGHKNLILGAWGCGAFGNKPDEVAECFRKVLIDEGLGRAFDEVCFAVYGSTDGKNYKAFAEAFK